MGMTLLDKRVKAERKKLEAHLEDNGLKLSTGRLRVFNVIMNTHGHFAAEEVLKSCKKCKVTVSRATIYRSIKELLEAGIIRETAFGEKHQHFEHVYDEKLHHHAKCIRCGAFVEFPDFGEEKVYLSILKKKGFEVLGHEMHFYGICKKCQGLPK